MLPNWLIVALIGFVFAAVYGIFVARKAVARKPLKGGRAAYILHYLGTVTSVAIAPMVCIGSFVFRIPFAESATLCLGSMLLSFVMMSLYAIVTLRTPAI